VVCSLRTKRAACTSSFMTTMQPWPRAVSLTATWTAASRLAGPSAPASEGLRIAPVTMTGMPGSRRRSSANALSSIVSVPWVTTTPRQPCAASSRIAAASSSRSSKPRCAPGICRNDRASTRATSTSCGTAATSISAVRVGTTPPSALGLMAMVPPSASTVTFGWLTAISCPHPGAMLRADYCSLVDAAAPDPENRCRGGARRRPANYDNAVETDPMSEVLIQTVDDGVCTLTMNRVERRNALSPELLSALVDAVGRASNDDAVGAIVLRGEGGYFCVGGDVKAMAEGAGRDAGYEARVASLRARMEVSR